MVVSQIIENTGHGFLFSFTTTFLMNAFKNRSLFAKTEMSMRQASQQAKNSFLHATTVASYERLFQRTPNVFFGSFLSGILFGNKQGIVNNIRNGVFVGASAYFFDRIYRK